MASRSRQRPGTTHNPASNPVNNPASNPVNNPVNSRAANPVANPAVSQAVKDLVSSPVSNLVVNLVVNLAVNLAVNLVANLASSPAANPVLETDKDRNNSDRTSAGSRPAGVRVSIGMPIVIWALSWDAGVPTVEAATTRGRSRASILPDGPTASVKWKKWSTCLRCGTTWPRPANRLGTCDSSRARLGRNLTGRLSAGRSSGRWWRSAIASPRNSPGATSATRSFR